MATLKSLVDETGNIKNELVECHTNLKNNLIAKGVECSDNDKMSSLIDKVNDLKTSIKVTVSDNIIISTHVDYSYVVNVNNYVNAFNFLTFFEGSARISFSTRVGSSGGEVYVKITHKRGNTEVKSHEISTSLYPNAVASSYDVENILVGDIISIDVKNKYSSHTGYIYGIKVKGDVIQ